MATASSDATRRARLTPVNWANAGSTPPDGNLRPLSHRPRPPPSPMRVNFCERCAAPVRIAIVLQLHHGPRCVHELVDALNMAQPLISQHLRVLKTAGVVAG